MVEAISWSKPAMRLIQTSSYFEREFVPKLKEKYQNKVLNVTYLQVRNYLHFDLN